MGAYTAYGLYAAGAAGLMIDHNRISDPGALTGGGFTAVSMNATPTASSSSTTSTRAAASPTFISSIWPTAPPASRSRTTSSPTG